MASLEELKEQRRRLNAAIAAKKRKGKRMPARAQAGSKFRKKYPNLSASLDNAARNMWG